MKLWQASALGMLRPHRRFSWERRGGRWMTVDDFGNVIRWTRKSQARGFVRRERDAGRPARMLRYQSGRVWRSICPDHEILKAEDDIRP